MKNFIFVNLLLVTISISSFASDAKYVCAESKTYAASDIQEALNSLKCDTNKPVSVTSMPEQANNSVVVCCVQ